MKNLYIYESNFEVLMMYGIMNRFKIYIKDYSNDNFVVVKLSDPVYMFEDAWNHYFVSQIIKNTLSMRQFIEYNMKKFFKKFQNERIKYYYGL